MMLRTSVPEFGLGRTFLTAVLAATCLLLFAFAVIGWGRYFQMRDMVQQSCQTQVAALYLVEWVDVCRMVQTQAGR
jgi:hypothetical protein